jgi:zinc transport system permease protein
MNQLWNLLGHELVRHALLAGALASIASGVVGTYVVVRRITYIAGGIAHVVLGGLGVARYLQVVHGVAWLDPMLGATAAALLAAVIIGWVSLVARQREDTVIGALWAVGMAIGVIFLHMTPGYNDVANMLLGNILMVSQRDLWLILILDVLVVGLGLLFFNQFQAVCFDEEFARLRGVRTRFFYLLLLCLTALTVVVLMKVVGIVMVIAMLTLPVAVAGAFSRSLWQMMILSAVAGIALTTGGMTLSLITDLPAGGVIVLLAGAAYLGVLVFKRGGRGKSLNAAER